MRDMVREAMRWAIKQNSEKYRKIIVDTLNEKEDEWMKCKFCGAEKTNFSTLFRNEPVCPRCFDISVCISAYYNKQISEEERAKKDGPTMRVSYNGVTGELVRLERRVIDPKSLYIGRIPIEFYDRYEVDIFTPENGGVVSFTDVKLEEVKLLGGAVVFDERKCCINEKNEKR